LKKKLKLTTLEASLMGELFRGSSDPEFRAQAETAEPPWVQAHEALSRGLLPGVGISPILSARELKRRSEPILNLKDFRQILRGGRLTELQRREALGIPIAGQGTRPTDLQDVVERGVLGLRRIETGFRAIQDPADRPTGAVTSAQKALRQNQSP